MQVYRLLVFFYYFYTTFFGVRQLLKKPCKMQSFLR